MPNEERRSRYKREPRKPELIARAKVGQGWVTIGAAWRLRGDQHGFSVKLNTMPIGQWEGNFVLVHPLPEDEEGHDPETGEVRDRGKNDEEIPF